MTLMAVSGIGAAIPFLLFLACPLMMVLMMRGMHGQGGHRGHAEAKPRSEMTLDELKDERDALNEEIGQRAEQYDHTNTRRNGVTT